MRSRSLVISEKRGAVGYVRLNSPENRNALTVELVNELLTSIKAFEKDPDIRVIVLSATGNYFCSGGDLKYFQEAPTKPVYQLHSENMALIHLFRLGFELKTPLLAAVNGPALGGGVGLVAMSHFALASNKATFAIVELGLGMAPFSIWPWLVKNLGYKKALELTLTRQAIDADTALRIGLINKVVPEGELESATKEICSRILQLAPEVTKIFLEGISYINKAEISLALEFLTSLRSLSFLSDELREGVSALLEKRLPSWALSLNQSGGGVVGEGSEGHANQ